MLRYKKTLLLSNEPLHDYASLTGSELKAVLVGLRRVLWLLDVGLFLRRKLKITHEQNVIIFQFYIRMPN